MVSNPQKPHQEGWMIKYALVALIAFTVGVSVSYLYSMRAFFVLTQLSAEADLHRDAALIEQLQLGLVDNVSEVLLLSLCANRTILQEHSESFLWPDKATSDRHLANTSSYESRCR